MSRTGGHDVLLDVSAKHRVATSRNFSEKSAMETALSAMQVQRKVFTVEYSLNMVAVLSTITFSAYFHTTVTDRIICDCELKGIITVTISHATCSDTNWWFNFILKVYSLVLQSGLFQFSCLVTD